MAFCDAAMARISRRTAQGKRTCVVLDVDNTLVDTRARTRAAAQSFARKNPGFARLGQLKLNRVGYNGQQTAAALGYGAPKTRRFQSYWERYFWNPKNFRHDKPIAPTVDLARRAKAAGAEVYYLTGRVDRFKAGTISQLKRLGLPDVDQTHVMCKPSKPLMVKPNGERVFVPTAPFKLGRVKQLHRRQPVALFLSDSAADIAAMQRGARSVACVMVDFPVGPGRGPAVGPGTPTITVR